MQAVKAMLKEHPQLAQSFSEEDLQPYLSMCDAPEPDLFIRTGGEQRISNFMLWQLAYTELYFTDTLWPALTAMNWTRRSLRTNSASGVWPDQRGSCRAKLKGRPVYRKRSMSTGNAGLEGNIRC